MKLSLSCKMGYSAAILLSTTPVQSADMALSGSVLGVDGAPLSGVVVSLAQAGVSVATDAAGAWNLTAALAGIRSTSHASHDGPGHLSLVNGRLAVSFSERDISGRGHGRAFATPRKLGMSARAAGFQDTLLYSFKGKVRLRDTVSESRTGIVRVLDTTFNAEVVYGYLEDPRDGMVYRTVKIGSQVWMAQNLNATVDSSWCSFKDTANCAKYGRLYSWSAVMKLNTACDTLLCANQIPPKHQGVCPSGWRLPGSAEWDALMTSVGGRSTAGKKLRSIEGWGTSIETDAYGFRALPAGNRFSSNSFMGLGSSAYFWEASEFSSTMAWDRTIYSSGADMSNDYSSKNVGFSLRCLQGN